LQFTNVLRTENRFTYLTNGAGLAVGDYDGDGLVDIYLVSQDGPNQLWRQTAPLRFEDATARAGGVDGGDAWGTGATFADVDGDGDLDLYVCNLEANNLLYENQGDGTFRENAAKFGLDLCAASMMAAFADYDRDGSLDLYLLTNRALHVGWARTPEVLSGIRPGAATRRPAATPICRPNCASTSWCSPASASRPASPTGCCARSAASSSMSRRAAASRATAWACRRAGGTTTMTATRISTSPTTSSRPTCSTTTNAMAASAR
jgi:hypothetical protein